MSEKDEKVKSPAVMPKATPKQLRWIYLGVPMIERGKDGQILFQIRYAQTFNNGLPSEVEERMKADGDFKRMFVEHKDAAKTMAELSKPDSSLSIAKKALSERYLKSKKRG